MNVRRSLESSREISMAYALYLTCREQHIVTYRESKGKDKTIQKVRPYTTGWAVLPVAGGVLDQPHRLMSLLETFMQGDREGFDKDRR